MERRRPDSLAQPQQPPTTTLLFSSLAILYLVLVYFRLSPQQLACDALVRLLPQRFLLSPAQRQELNAAGMHAHAHAAKKEAFRGLLGLGGAALLGKLPAGASDGIGMMRRASTTFFSSSTVQADSDVPAGLGNYDNSCYQNCVLQGLASLEALLLYLNQVEGTDKTKEDGQSMSGSLGELIGRLNDEGNNGRQLWTPAKLKNMSSWQQQDAQEYFSKILEEVEKDAGNAFSAGPGMKKPGLESLVENEDGAVIAEENESTAPARNPLDGLLAQKVTCTRCNFSEGLSMIPFNCLTLPLPLASAATDLDSCLDAYTATEEIPEVDCAKCTLQRAQHQLRQMLPANPTFQCTDTTAQDEQEKKAMQLPPELRVQAFHRLASIQRALQQDDFADKTLAELCQISKKAHVASTKTKSVAIARAPPCLVVHVNRSVFDEVNGVQRKNYARVSYPLTLDLAGWMLHDSAAEEEQREEVLYRLKAVVTHYGRHENGHYICYRRHPMRRKEAVAEDVDEGSSEAEHDGSLDEEKSDPWYRLSDEDVSPVSEEDVLGQGGVFMLFYEREAVPPPPLPALERHVNATTTAETVPAEQELSAPVVAEDNPAILPPFDQDHLDSQSALPTPSSSTFSDSAFSSPFDTDQHSTEATTEDECEVEPDAFELTLPKSTPTSPVRMRTARFVDEKREDEREFGTGAGLRVVAAT